MKTKLLMSLMTTLLVLTAPVHAERIKDIANIQGVRSNQLIGYGLVVGLPGTGEKTRYTEQTFRTMLKNFGINLPDSVRPNSKNVAVVAVHADMPAFIKPGQNLDVTVSSLGEAKSLRGGTLIQTFLKGVDGNVYAIAQGSLIVGGLGAEGLDGSRVQFTPDLMPADILGSEVLETKADGSREFRFIEGPIFCQLLMADEINRASPRTQSALLQAMQEKEVTIAGQHRPLGKPFHVLATQNPIEQEGTYPLPEAQLDRFLLQIEVNYPDRQVERDILLATTGVDEGIVKQVFNADDLLAAQTLLRRMPVGESVVDLILDLVRAFRPDDSQAPEITRNSVSWGPGPRAAQALMLAVRARALLDGRLAPSADDVAKLARPVLMHRMALGFGARAQGQDLGAVIDQVTNDILAQSTRKGAAA